MVMRLLEKMLRPIRNRLTLMVSRAVLLMADDEHLLQELQVRILGQEVLDGLERFQQYGLTSVPLPGAEAITLSVGGRRSHTVVINVDDRRYRLKGLEGGEVALYTDEGDYIHFKRGRIVEAKAGTRLSIDTPRLEVTGDVIDRTASGNAHTVREMREIYNDHTHTGDDGGNTSTPHQEQ